jgi:conjugative relaxase-like TrwC/TraI family protein
MGRDIGGGSGRAGTSAAVRRVHAHRAGGVRQEDAHGWVVASWRQHTSRRGDPQLHIHNTILNKARTERDGGMRTLDGRMLYQERAAAAGIATLVTENQLTRDLGVEWVPRTAGKSKASRRR